MKKKNSVSEFTSERNAILVEHFRRQLATQSKIDLQRVFKGVVDQPAPRFWVSETRAAVIISKLLKGEDPLADMYQQKREMYLELFSRVKELLNVLPDASITDLVFEAVNQPAPKSYMSWQRARDVINKERGSYRKRHSHLDMGIKAEKTERRLK